MGSSEKPVYSYVRCITNCFNYACYFHAVSYTHLRAHETVLDLVCRLLLEKKNNNDLYYVHPFTPPLYYLHFYITSLI